MSRTDPAVAARLARAREWHGYVFRGFPRPVEEAILHYINTGEKTADYPAPTVHPSRLRKQNKQPS